MQVASPSTPLASNSGNAFFSQGSGFLSTKDLGTSSNKRSFDSAELLSAGTNGEHPGKENVKSSAPLATNFKRRKSSVALDYNGDLLELYNFRGTDRPRKSSFSGILSLSKGMDIITPQSFNSRLDAVAENGKGLSDADIASFIGNGNMYGTSNLEATSQVDTAMFDNLLKQVVANPVKPQEMSTLECCDTKFPSFPDLLEHYEKKHVGPTPLDADLTAAANSMINGQKNVFPSPPMAQATEVKKDDSSNLTYGKDKSPLIPNSLPTGTNDNGLLSENGNISQQALFAKGNTLPLTPPMDFTPLASGNNSPVAPQASPAKKMNSPYIDTRSPLISFSPSIGSLNLSQNMSSSSLTPELSRMQFNDNSVSSTTSSVASFNTIAGYAPQQQQPQFYNAHLMNLVGTLPQRPSSTPAMMFNNNGVQHNFNQNVQQHSMLNSPLMMNQPSLVSSPLVNSMPSSSVGTPIVQNMTPIERAMTPQFDMMNQQHMQMQNQPQTPLMGTPTMGTPMGSTPTVSTPVATPTVATVLASTCKDSTGQPVIDSNGKKVYKCPRAYCSKIYKNSNGLRYHLERGNCELYYSGGEVNPEMNEITPEVYGARQIAQTAQLQKQQERQEKHLIKRKKDLEKAGLSLPPGSMDASQDQIRRKQLQRQQLLMSAAISGNGAINPNAAASIGDIKIALRPYWCKVNGCGKKYKNLNGLKYHAKISHPTLNFKEEVKGHTSLC